MKMQKDLPREVFLHLFRLQLMALYVGSFDIQKI